MDSSVPGWPRVQCTGHEAVSGQLECNVVREK
jgi:hypothetical protein